MGALLLQIGGTLTQNVGHFAPAGGGGAWPQWPPPLYQSLLHLPTSKEMKPIFSIIFVSPKDKAWSVIVSGYFGVQSYDKLEINFRVQSYTRVGIYMPESYNI